MGNKPNSTSHENRARRAYSTMVEIRGALYRRLVDYVNGNENRLRDEVSGDDSYSFTLQQLDEQFLNKLNIIERAISELSRCDHRDGQTTTTTYEAVEVIAKRDELPQKIADALAEHGDSDFLDLSVLRADEEQAEVLLIMAREEHGSLPSSSRPERHEHGEHGEQGEAGESGSGPQQN